MASASSKEFLEIQANYRVYIHSEPREWHDNNIQAEQKVASNEQTLTSNVEKVISNEQKVTSNEEKLRSKKKQAKHFTSYKTKVIQTDLCICSNISAYLDIFSQIQT